MLYEISHLSKNYRINKDLNFSAIKNINLTLPDTGLVLITGESGSGKTTLLNMLSLVDKPSIGRVIFKGKNIHSYSKNERRKYLNNNIGIVFQHFELINELSVEENIILPLLMSKRKNRDINDLLSSLGIKHLMSSKVKDLSGGEKQRVAIGRAIINEPNVLLCDEPTGALDEDNTKQIMEVLHGISRNKLVVVVSHDLSFASYADRIIKMKDGKIYHDETLHKTLNIDLKNKRYPSLSSKWITKLQLSHIRKHYKKNVFIIISLFVSILSSILISAFALNAPNEVAIEKMKHLDIGSLTITKQENNVFQTGLVNIVKESRPTLLEIANLPIHLSSYYLELNYSSLVPEIVDLKYSDDLNYSIAYRPVYSFCDSSYDKSLLKLGEFPKQDSLVECVINESMYEMLKKNNFDVLNKRIDISYSFSYKLCTFDEYNTEIEDYLSFSKNVKVIGVVEELDYLSTPTIYYPYIAIDEWLSEYLMNNYSSYLGHDYTWKELIMDSKSDEIVTNYSYRLFLKDVKNLDILVDDYDLNLGQFKLTSSNFIIASSLGQLIDLSSIGLLFYLLIAIIGTILIISIISITSYVEEHKENAILLCLGASNTAVYHLYILENVMLSIVALVISYSLAYPISLGINALINHFSGLEQLIKIPLLINTGFIPIPFVFILAIAIVLIIYISTYVPLFFSQKCELRKELVEE